MDKTIGRLDGVVDITDATAIPAFRCRREIVDREAFQREGHWVSGAEKEDKLRPRPIMAGKNVYILTLYHSQLPDRQMLRVQGGTELEARMDMERAIVDHLMSLQRAQWIREFDADQLAFLNRERGRLAEFLAAHYGEEVDPARDDMRTVVEVAIRHLRAERERWSARLGDWLLRMVGRPRRTGWTRPEGMTRPAGMKTKGRDNGGIAG
jgi:hypothetical protein